MGFSLVELLVVISILGLLMAILLPSLARARDLMTRASCATQQREIVRACLTFANDGRFHRNARPLTLPTNDPNSNNWGDVVEGNPGSLWLLIENRLLPSAMFMCPAVGEGRTIAPSEYSSGLDISAAPIYGYSYLSQVPFTDADTNLPVSATAIDKVESSLVILGDLNPRCTLGTTGILPYERSGPDPNVAVTGVWRGNSKSHDRRGQNFGRLDGSVKWVSYNDPNAARDPNNNEDDPYSSGDSTKESGGKRKRIGDSFLIP